VSWRNAQGLAAGQPVCAEQDKGLGFSPLKDRRGKWCHHHQRLRTGPGIASQRSDWILVLTPEYPGVTRCAVVVKSSFAAVILVLFFSFTLV